MSRITRRTFLRTCTTMASVVTLAACSQASTTALTTGLVQPQITIWSTPGSIDQALARWRRVNPDVSVRRQVVAATDLDDLLQTLPTRTTDIPDLIVADSYTIATQQNINIWRHIDTSTVKAELHSAALGHVFIDERRIIGVPLTCNPLKLWYQSEILLDTLGLRDAAQVQTAVGNSWDAFASFIDQLHRNNPIITTLASCFDDACYPLAVDAMQQQRPITDACMQSFALAKQRIIGRAIHFGGEWFDLLKRNSVALMVGGRYLSTAVARTWNNEKRSPWQAIQHPLGHVYGPSMIAAIPIQAAQYERATQLLINLLTDPELQVLISNESGSIPALISAYEHPDMQGVDAILPQESIRDTWSTPNSIQLPMIDRQSISQLKQVKNAFYTWQNGTITDESLQISLSDILANVQ